MRMPPERTRRPLGGANGGGVRLPPWLTSAAPSRELQGAPECLTEKSERVSDDRLGADSPRWGQRAAFLLLAFLLPKLQGSQEWNP